MTRKLFLQVWLPLLAALLLGVAAGHIVRRPLALLAVVFLLALVTLAAALAARFVAVLTLRRTERLNRFAAQMASGSVGARLAEGTGEISPDAARALNAAASALQEKMRTLEDSRRNLETVLDSMEEAVIAVNEKG